MLIALTTFLTTFFLLFLIFLSAKAHLSFFSKTFCFLRFFSSSKKFLLSLLNNFCLSSLIENQIARHRHENRPPSRIFVRSEWLCVFFNPFIRRSSVLDGGLSSSNWFNTKEACKQRVQLTAVRPLHLHWLSMLWHGKAKQVGAWGLGLGYFESRLWELTWRKATEFKRNVHS